MSTEWDDQPILAGDVLDSAKGMTRALVEQHGDLARWYDAANPDQERELL